MHELNEMPDQTYDADGWNKHTAAITQIKKVKLNFLDLLHEYKKGGGEECAAITGVF